MYDFSLLCGLPYILVELKIEFDPVLSRLRFVGNYMHNYVGFCWNDSELIDLTVVIRLDNPTIWHMIIHK